MSPQPVGNSNLSVYASGTLYSLTNAAAAVDFGTTDPVITISEPGTYLLLARLRFDYNGATFAAVQTIAAKLRRLNNTAADLTNAVAGMKTQIITTQTFTAGDVNIPPTIYTTVNNNDQIQIFASIGVVPSAGSVDVAEAEIVAIKLQ